jgi:hypothetical protein
MTEDAEGQGSGLLAEQRLGRSGLVVKLDKGFADGTYVCYVEYDALAANVGIAAARRKAAEYSALLKAHLGQAEGYDLGDTEDATRHGGRGRKRDLEATFLSFPLTSADGLCHDASLREHFRVALLRTGQAWEQGEAHAQAQRRDRRKEEFRRRLARLLDGVAYAQLDRATKERLLGEVPDLAFAQREPRL